MGKSYGTDDDLQYRVPYPEIRWSRDFPRVASERASFTEAVSYTHLTLPTKG